MEKVHRYVRLGFSLTASVVVWGYKTEYAWHTDMKSAWAITILDR